MPAKTGQEYIDRINQMESNIWINGEKVTGKKSEHPAFQGILSSQAALYDRQHVQELKDLMTYPSPSTGDVVGTSFLQSKTREDLVKRRLMIQHWAKFHGGMIGRSPDYMNTILMALNAAADLFNEQDFQCTQNIRRYYEYCRENDLSLTHTFVNPQINRSFLAEALGNNAAAQMVTKTNDGILINGARTLATQGGITDEILVFPVPTPIIATENPYAIAFALPNQTPGLKYICREPFDYGKSQFDHPLGSRFDEIDTIVIFENVLVPWDRVFIHGNTGLANKVFKESNFYPHVSHLVVAKNIIKTEFILGIVQLIVDTIQISDYQHVQEKVAEVITVLETMKGFLISSEVNASLDRWGTFTPDPNPLFSACFYFPRIYPRLIEIIQLLGASGLVATPTEDDFKSDIRTDLEQYLHGSNIEAFDRVRLFRLAWDVSMSAFGSRQVLYERFFFGDSVRTAARVYQHYEKEKYTGLVLDFLAKQPPLS